MSVPSSSSSRANTPGPSKTSRHRTDTEEQRSWVHRLLRKYLAKYVRDYISKKENNIPSPVCSYIDLRDENGNGKNSSRTSPSSSAARVGGSKLGSSSKRGSLTNSSRKSLSESKPVEPSASSSTYASTERNLTKLLKIADLEIVEEIALGDDRISYLSRILSLGVTYVIKDQPEHSLQWLAKVPSKHFDERNLARVANAYRREVSFYVNILQDIKLWLEHHNLEVDDQKLELKVPTCFYANSQEFDLEFDPVVYEFPNEEFTLIMEDLRVQGYGKRHFSTGLTAEEAEEAVREIVKFHAISWAMGQHSPERTLHWPEMLRWNDLYNLSLDMIRQGFRHLHHFKRESLRNSESIELIDALLALETKLPGKLESLLKPLPQPAATALVHMDFWADNLLFKENINEEEHEEKMEENEKEEQRKTDITIPTKKTVHPPNVELDCMILDWQMAGLGRVSHDLGILMITSLDGELRREKTVHLLKFYYETFEKIAMACKLNVPFTFDDLIDQYKDSCLLAVLMAVGRLDLVVSEQSTLERFFEALKDLRDENLI